MQNHHLSLCYTQFRNWMLTELGYSFHLLFWSPGTKGSSRETVVIVVMSDGHLWQCDEVTTLHAL